MCKKSIFYLGILATLFVSTSNANTITNQTQSLTLKFTNATSEMAVVTDSTSEVTLKKPTIIVDPESKIMESISAISSNYKKSTEEIIEEDQKITEYQAEHYLPLTIVPTIQDYIAIDNQIIESTITNEILPIDSVLINSSNTMLSTSKLKKKEVSKL